MVNTTNVPVKIEILSKTRENSCVTPPVILPPSQLTITIKERAMLVNPNIKTTLDNATSRRSILIRNI